MCRLATVSILLIAIQHIKGLISYGNECPIENITFSKTFGVRPSETQFYILYYKDENSPRIIEECLSRCKNDLLCTNIILKYNNSECYQYQYRNNENTNFSYRMKDFNLINDLNAVFFEKICLSVPRECISKMWISERVINYTLIGNGLILPGLYTQSQCAEKCLSESRFICHSANYIMKNDYRNMMQNNTTYTLGSCHLNDADRHILPNAFRASNYGNDYIENQCLDIATGEHCFYEEYRNKVFPNTISEEIVQSKDVCQTKCDTNILFNCYGYSLIPTNDSFLVCRLHSEDLYLIGPNSLKTNINGRYFERTKCLDLSVSCTKIDMFVKYTPDIKFTGRIYMQGYSEKEECNVYGRGNTSITLRLDISNRTCGLTEALSNSDSNRTLIFGYLIIQYNRLIQTQGDRLVKIGCLVNNDINDPIDNVTVDYSVHLNSSFPDQGEIIIANSSIKPIIRIMIVDPITNMDINEVQIGQEIQLRIQIEPADGPYDISAGKLWALTENETDSILLLDDFGCPVRPNIFPGLIKTRFPTKLVLTSNFLAFKFTSSSTVKFKIMIHFCILKCPEINCTNGRKIRSADLSDTSMTNRNENLNSIYNNGPMIPIEYVIIVNTNNTSERFTMDHGRILIAGYDVFRNQVCLDYSLLLGLMVFWLIVQLIIFIGCIMVVRKYKKLYDMTYNQPSLYESHSNFGSNNSQRRLHWEDQTYGRSPHSIFE